MEAIVIAAIACIAYVVISLIVGDLFPFSRYSMYAQLTTRKEGAVLYVRVGERFVSPDDLDSFHGLDVPALDPKLVPCSQQWFVYESQRWMDLQRVGSRVEGAVEIEVGYRMLAIDEQGALSERLAPVTRGTARLRT